MASLITNMAIEIEKKYRITESEMSALRNRLKDAGAIFRGTEFEENILYKGPGINPETTVLRLRKTEKKSVLTFKQKQTSRDGIKRNREEETVVERAETVDAILHALGYSQALIYEKRRETWKLEGCELVLDTLPFGLFIEIEGEEAIIRQTEELLQLSSLETETATYPELTTLHGSIKDSVIEARFS
jgi:adenylate cyclase, class 2